MPEPERSFAGYTFHQRLSVGFYGTAYRAVGGNHQEARILEIDPAMSARSGFVEALERFGSNLGLLEHKNVQATILVGKTPSDQHLVVNEATPGALTLEQVLTDAAAAGATLSPAVALALGRAVVSGLTHAHGVGIVHGAVHPRSVLVDYHGGVKLADFAAARALAETVAAADEPQVLKVKGFLAPELALGDPPSVSTDVYAVGALLHMLLSGSPPPGRLDVPPELAAVIAKAVQTSPEDRFPSAIELRAAVRGAVETGGAAVASVKDLASFVSGLRGAAEASLEQETEDVLAFLASDKERDAPPPEPPRRRARAARMGTETSTDQGMEGRVVLGHYRILRHLADGGMGAIYLARSEGARSFMRPVVVKCLLRGYIGDQKMLTLFAREARIMSNLRHPGIVSVIDFEQEGDMYMMVMDYVHGFHVGRWHKFIKHVRGDFPVEIAVHIIVHTLRALHYAHTLKAADGTPLNIVHRDVTSSNVLLDVEGHVKLADFGIAQINTDRTEIGKRSIRGKFPYLAPEILENADPSPSTDVYSAGVTLHELLVGHNEFGANSIPAIVSRVLRHEPTPVDRVRPDVSAGLAPVIAKALAKRPQDRYRTAAEFAEALSSQRTLSEDEAARQLAELTSSDFRDPRMAQMFAVPKLNELETDWTTPAFDISDLPGLDRGGAEQVKVGYEDPATGLDDGVGYAKDTPRPERIATDDILVEDDEDYEQPTTVDEAPQVSIDPVSAIIRADRGPAGESLVRLGAEHGDEDTYIPPAMTESDVELASVARAAVRRSRSEPRIAPDPAVDRATGERPAIRPPSGSDLGAPMMQLERGGGGLWIMALVIIGTIGGVFLYKKLKDRPEPTTTVHKIGAGVKAGNITVTANQPDAAVWLKLGRTPLDTLPLSAANVHQIRVEHEGYVAADINVLGSMWSGSGTHMRAVLSARLEQARPGELGEAYPPAPQRPKTGREGRGILHITSTPPGAHAYLLVGFTPDVELRDVHAGRQYEFKIAKDGFTPGFVVIRAEDWKQGDGLKRGVERTAELAPLPPEQGKKQ